MVDGGARTHPQVLRGVRIATLLVCLVVIGFGGLNMARHLTDGRDPLVQVGSFAVLVAVLAVEAVLLVRDAAWGRLRPFALSVVLAVAALSAATRADGPAPVTADWVLGATNFVGAAVLQERPPRCTGAFLLVNQVISLVGLLAQHGAGRAALLAVVTGAGNAISVLCLVMGAAAVCRVHAAAVASVREIERIRTEEAVVKASHARRRQRRAELDGSTVPLLEGLADGSLRPDDLGVQRRCAIEAARMRRLFAAVDADPLLQELGHCADLADGKGIVVELEARGHWPSPPREVRRDLTDAVLGVLAAARSRARITVIGNADRVSVAVVADCGPVDLATPTAPGVQVEGFGDERTTWVEAQWAT